MTTYPANRLLQVGAPGPGGMVTLDFNRAVNLACAYTNFVTCPLPPPENRLPVWIEAGEKIPTSGPPRAQLVAVIRYRSRPSRPLA